jgi:site-specific DNA recombinase
MKEQEKTAKNNEKEANEYQRQIEQNRELLFKLRKQKMLGELDDAQYNFEREMYEKDIAELEAKLEKVQSELNQQKDYAEERANIKAAVEELTNLDSYDEVDKVRITLSKLIKEITVDTITIRDIKFIGPFRFMFWFKVYKSFFITLLKRN